MATMFGRFEVQSELSKSDTALIYKVMDTETNQVVALKTQSLRPLGGRSDRFVDTLIREGESTRDLVCQNIVLLYGAGEIDGQFCAAMEYIQGNSITSMLARKDGFSIWDLLDITLQVCAGLEHAAAKNVIHCSLEPAKIMVQWDGTVKILGYGISNMSLIEAESGKSLGRLMPYCSPEQIRGEAVDLRSNLFSLGTILYEMVAGRKAFDAADPVALVQQMENEIPPSPTSVNSKIQPEVSAVIMKALAKSPAERYQSARELLDELEKCKDNGKKPVSESKSTATPPIVPLDPAAQAAAASKFVSPPSRAPKPATAVPPASIPTGSESSSQTEAPAYLRGNAPPEAKSAAAGAGGTGDAGGLNTSAGAKANPRVIGKFDVNAPEYQAARVAVLSAAPIAPPVPEPTRRAPAAAIDPMMAQPAPGSSGKSFSDLAEMPTLKPPVFNPAIHDVVEPTVSEAHIYQGNEPAKEEKPRIQPREVAGKALRQIVTIPPRLMLYSILGAVGLILVIVIAIFFHVRSEDDITGPSRPAATAEPSSTSIRPAIPEKAAPQIQKAIPAIAEVQPNLKVRQVRKATLHSAGRAPAPTPAPAVISGQALIDSNPQGAHFQVDQASDPSWITPFTLSDLSPGKHIISVSKAGYSSEVRSVEVFAGTRSSLVLHLSPVNALMVVNSSPAGADVIVDGKSTGRTTPAQFEVEKGSHTILLRKQGYLDDSVTANLSPAQNFQYSPQLKALGNTADMRTVGKFGKLFGHGGDSTAGMGSISVHTQPKGAQIAINRSVLEKMSPVDVMLGPGNYVVDITLTGFKPVHKVVSVDKGGKVAIDEILERQ